MKCGNYYFHGTREYVCGDTNCYNNSISVTKHDEVSLHTYIFMLVQYKYTHQCHHYSLMVVICWGKDYYYNTVTVFYRINIHHIVITAYRVVVSVFNFMKQSFGGHFVSIHI